MQFTIPQIFDAVCEAHPASVAIVHRERRITRIALQEESYRLANFLIGEGLGRPGSDDDAPWSSPHDHLGIMLHNCPEYILGVLAAHRARMAPFNINFKYTSTELAYLFRDARPRALLFHARFAGVIAEAVAGLSTAPILIEVPDDTGHSRLPGTRRLSDVLADSTSEAPDVLPSVDDLHIVYTGGTTGLPKGVLWRQGEYLEGPIWFLDRHDNPYGSIDEIVAASHRRTSGKLLPAPPFMHGTALWSSLMILLAGGTLVVQSVNDHLDASDVLSVAERERVTSIVMVGDAFGRPLVDELERGDYDLSAVRAFVNSGAFLSLPVRERLLHHAPNARIQDNLGSTESGPQAVNPEFSSLTFEPKPSLSLYDETLTERLQPGDERVGWICKSGSLPRGYLADPDKTKATFKVIDGQRMVVTGDRARFLANRQIELLGRESQTINSGGEKIFAEEIELALRRIPGVVDALVVGRDSQRWGKEVAAVVSISEGSDALSPASLKETLAKTLARYKLPKEIVVVDLVHRLPNGKADYRWARSVLTVT